MSQKADLILSAEANFAVFMCFFSGSLESSFMPELSRKLLDFRGNSFLFPSQSFKTLFSNYFCISWTEIGRYAIPERSKVTRNETRKFSLKLF